jgi:microsomal epoxide hydrolase
MMGEARGFRIAVADERLAAIRRQVAGFAWDAIPELVEHGDPWSAGASVGFMRELCAYWVDGFDWRAQEAKINRFPQFMARVGGQDIHLIHERGSGPRDAALVLTHGWPGSVVEFLEIIDRLAHPERFGGRPEDGIDVVVPALPGFGFSGRPPVPIGPRAIAGLWDRLVRGTLGYERYIAQGGDWGSMVSAMAGLHHPVTRGGGCEAIHINMLGSRVEDEIESADEAEYAERCAPFLTDGRAYAETHRTTPQTLAYAMADNPVAQAAWIVDKFHAWTDLRGGKDLTDVVDRDTLLTNIMFYVATGNFATATWIYRAVHAEPVRVLPKGSYVEVPTGFASFPQEIRPRPPEGLLKKTYNLQQFTEYDKGGHFAALELPDALVGDIARFLRAVREGRK